MQTARNMLGRQLLLDAYLWMFIFISSRVGLKANESKSARKQKVKVEADHEYVDKLLCILERRLLLFACPLSLDWQSLVTFSTLNKSYRDLATPILFKNIHFKQSRENTAEGLRFFFEKRPDISIFVQSLQISYRGYASQYRKRADGRHSNMKRHPGFVSLLESSVQNAPRLKSVWLEEAYGLFNSPSSSFMALIASSSSIVDIRLHFVDMTTLDQLGILHNLVSLHIQIKKDEVFKMDPTWENGLGHAVRQSKDTLQTLIVINFRHAAPLLAQGRGIATHMGQFTNSNAHQS